MLVGVTATGGTIIGEKTPESLILNVFAGNPIVVHFKTYRLLLLLMLPVGALMSALSLVPYAEISSRTTAQAQASRPVIHSVEPEHPPLYCPEFRVRQRKDPGHHREKTWPLPPMRDCSFES